MKFEKQLYNLVSTLGYSAFWIHKSLTEPDTKFPIIVLSFIADDQGLYLDSLASNKSGRITFSIHSKTETQVLNIKEELRSLLLHDSDADDFNFVENSGITVYEPNSKTYGYQLDMSFVYTGTE